MYTVLRTEKKQKEIFDRLSWSREASVQNQEAGATIASFFRKAKTLAKDTGGFCFIFYCVVLTQDLKFLELYRVHLVHPQHLLWHDLQSILLDLCHPQDLLRPNC